MNKRLGSSKSTMFNIGGITALKQHDFFSSIDWNQLLKCEIKPPIDLELVDINHMIYSSDNTTNTTSTNTNNNKTTENLKTEKSPLMNTNATNSTALDLKSIEKSLTKHFDEGFTNQSISLSILEDTVSVTSSYTPYRSRTNTDLDENDLESLVAFGLGMYYF